MASKKHYIITSLTFGAIAAGSAALIGVTNLITKDQIAKNEKNKIKAGICEIFGKSATISSDFALKDYKINNFDDLHHLLSDASLKELAKKLKI